MVDNTDFTGVLNMSAIGDKLKEAREKKGLTINQANKQTHIHQTVLKALEDGNCENILNQTYVKSFLRKYSDYLGLDSSRVMREYIRLRPDPGQAIVAKVSESKTTSNTMLNLLPAVKLIVTVVIVIALASFLIGNVVYYFNRSPTQRSAVASKTSRVSENAGSAKKSVAENPKSSKKIPVASVPKNVPLNLLLKVNQDVLIKIKTDGNLLFSRQLTKGTAEEFRADNSINIYVAKGESIELILNGKPLGPIGKGLLENIEITRSGVKIK